MTGMDEHFERLLNEHCSNLDLPECPECESLSLEVHEGKDRRGWWYEAECTNPECDYATSDCDTWEHDD